MEEAQAKALVHRYIDSWLAPNMEQFLSCLDPTAVVRECTGAVYRGRKEHTEWFTSWNGDGNRVYTWELHSLGYDSASQSAFAEWDFHCAYEGADYDWLGASIIRFRTGRIIELNEYERKRPTTP